MTTLRNRHSLGYLDGGIFFQKTYKLGDTKPGVDFKVGTVHKTPFLVMADLLLLMMGALSNDVTVFSRYAGFYKCIQSSSDVTAWCINILETSLTIKLIV
ncbi:hypothetical protein BX616_004902 [Lobosporangium transversale]|nr:hypothetical protein BX616_004902 [Lobosporangium transversale]